MKEIVKQFVSRYLTVSDSDIDFLLQMGERRNFDRRVRLIEEGDTEKYINIVLRGLAKKSFTHGKEVYVTQIATEGQLISAADSFLSNQPTVYCIETIEPTLFLSFTNSAIHTLYETDKKWQQLGRLLLTRLLVDKERWELDRVQFSTHERLNAFIERHSELVNRVPQRILASYLGIQPETFSRLKNNVKLNPIQ